MKHGAYEYIEKSFDIPRMKALIDEAVEVGRLMRTQVRMERELIVAALKEVGGNQVRAAQLLGISRVMLHDRIEKFDIKTETVVQDS